MRKNFGAKPYLYPQPVMIIGTYDENGNANAMNAAWGGIVGPDRINIIVLFKCIQKIRIYIFQVFSKVPILRRQLVPYIKSITNYKELHCKLTPSITSIPLS